MAIIAAWVLGVGAGGWLSLGAADRRQETALALEAAVQDSARYAVIIAQHDKLRARRDTIAQKLVIIEEVDAGRYIWSHLLDEISRALPDYTWLTRIAGSNGGSQSVALTITGRTGNTFALTRFLKDLEASPFVRGVQLTKTEVVSDPAGRMVHEFVLTASYEEPPLELLKTIPLHVGND
jgi:Tfp pilus assembly protein PilN